MTLPMSFQKKQLRYKKAYNMIQASRIVYLNLRGAFYEKEYFINILHCYNSYFNGYDNKFS